MTLGTTTWSQFRPDVGSIATDPKYDVTEGGQVGFNANTPEIYYAELATTAYQLDVKYHQSPILVDTPQGGGLGSTIPLVYKSCYVNGYDHVRAYEPIEQTQNLNNPIYVVFRGTQGAYDIFKDANIALQYTVGSNPLNAILTDVTSIYNSLKSLIDGAGRPVHIIGHSLGAFYAIHYGKMLQEQTSPTIPDIASMKMSLFNPLVLPDSAYDFFRDINQIDYDVKNNVNVYTIIGDFLSPLLLRAGFGTIHHYTNANVEIVVDDTSFELQNWLTDMGHATGWSNYLDMNNHRLSAFGGNANGIGAYELIDPWNWNGNNSYVRSLGTYTTKDVGQLRVPPVSDHEKLYLFDNPINYNEANLFVDNPKIDHDVASYNWVIEKWVETPYRISMGYNGVKYINFELKLTSSGRPGFHYYIYLEYNTLDAEISYYKIYDNLDTLYSLTASTINENTVLPIQLGMESQASFDALTQNSAIQRRFFTLEPLMTETDTRWSERRTYNSITEIPPPTPPTPDPPTPDPPTPDPPTPDPPSPVTPTNPWVNNTDDIQYHMWVQNLQSSSETRGHIGYVRIKSKYMSDLYNKDVLALNENTTNPNGYLTYSPKWANTEINWNDNDAQPDEHVWKIQYYGEDSGGEPLFNLTNTYSGFPFASWYIVNGTGAYLSANNGVKIDYHRHIAVGNNSPVVRTYYVKSIHFESASDDTLGKIFSRQTQYNLDHHYGSAAITTSSTTLDTDDRMREWIFEFI